MSSSDCIPRKAEPEYMDDPSEALAYAEADFAEVNQAFAERLVELAGPLSHTQALDLGTGPGDIPIRVLHLRPNWRITAVDAARPMVRYATQAARRAGLAEKIRFVLADAKATGLLSHSFPVVFSNSLLHHITDTGAFWTEIKRVGARGGLVFLRDLFRPATEKHARALVEEHAGSESELLKEEFYRSLLSAYTVEEIRKQLEEAGLGNLTVQKVTDRHVDIFGHLV